MNGALFIRPLLIVFESPMELLVNIPELRIKTGEREESCNAIVTESDVVCHSTWITVGRSTKDDR